MLARSILKSRVWNLHLFVRLILELRTISELLVLWEGKTMRELLFRPKTLREQQLLYVGVVLEEEATDFSSVKEKR